MELTVCGPTAFKFYRIPPQLLAAYPPVPEPCSVRNHSNRASCPLVTDLLGTPLYRLKTQGGARKSSKLYKTQTFHGNLPFGSIVETEHGFSVSSPLFTLLTLAPLISRMHLLMAMYEMCGTFSVFSPSQECELLLQQLESRGELPPWLGWRRVITSSGGKTDLWKRSPLVTLEDLERFSQELDGLKGSKAFRWAAKRVSGSCASPFEVQASLLLGLPKRDGGMGLTVKNNVRIPLSAQARALYPHSCCYADLYIDADENHPAIDIECQGRSVHDSEQAGLSDSDRFAAIESMGIQVVPLTYPQFSVKPSYEAVKKLIAEKMGQRLAPKTQSQQKLETRVRSEVFIDWNTLAAYEKPARKCAA